MQRAHDTTPRPQARLTQDQVTAVLGHIDPARQAAVIATGATLEELVEAVTWAKGERDIMGEERRPMAGPVAAVYDILTVEDELDED